VMGRRVNGLTIVEPSIADCRGDSFVEHASSFENQPSDVLQSSIHSAGPARFTHLPTFLQPCPSPSPPPPRDATG
jgi:hypothetical protein